MRPRLLGLATFACALAAVACAPGSDADGATGSSSGEASSGAEATGTVTLGFSVSNGVRMGPNLQDALVGPVYGALYLTSEVTITGPAEGAVPIVAIELDEVDLSTVEVAEVTWTSAPLPADRYTVLAMLDLDGNFEQSDELPDPGDPVTLPTQAFEIIAGEDMSFVVIFDMIYG